MITFLRALGMVCLTTWLLEDRRLDEGSTIKTWGPYSFIYRAKTSKRSKNRHLEPWPSVRVVVPSRWIEHLSSGYKSEVIAIILRRHMARAESIDLPWTFIQPWFSKPAVYLSRTPAQIFKYLLYIYCIHRSK